MAEARILVLGASSDIGIELVRGLLADGATVAAHAFSSGARLKGLACDRLRVILADLRESAGIAALCDAAQEALGTPTGIVHLPAARLELKRFGEFDWDRVENDLRVQVKSIGLILKRFLPAMGRLPGRSKVVFMLSSATLGTPPKYMGEYTVAKYALLGLMRSLAAEYAEKPISFNAVSPSMVETRFLGNLPEKFVEMAAASHPAKRHARVDDVVPAIRFLLSAGSDFMSGANLPITAGGTI
jgi:3-oxoacyl-[acyl-carrier protein] reductase